MKKNQRRIGFHFELNEEEENMIKILRDRYAINMSKFLKNCIRDKYNEIEKPK
jgi:hypothetical protein